MGLLNKSFNYNTGTIVNPARGAQKSLDSVSDMLNNYQSNELAKQKSEEEKQYRDKILGMKMADAKRSDDIYNAKLNQDKELANIFGGLETDTTKTKTIKGKSNANDISKINSENNVNKNILEKDMVSKGDRYNELFNKYSTQGESMFARSEQENIENKNILEPDGDRPGLMKKPDLAGFFSDAGGAIKRGYDSIFNSGEYGSRRNQDTINKSVENIQNSSMSPERKQAAIKSLVGNNNTGNPTTLKDILNKDKKITSTEPDADMTKVFEQASQRAMKESGLDKSAEDLAGFTGKTVPELISTKDKTTNETVRKTRSQFVKDAMNDIRSNDTLTGSTMIAAMSTVDGIADGIYGKKQKGRTFDQEYKLNKDRKAKLKEKRVLEGLKDLYPGSEKIDTVEAMEAYIKKIGKSDTGSKSGKSGVKLVEAMVDSDIDSGHMKELNTLFKNYKIPDKDMADLLLAFNRNYSWSPNWSSTVTNKTIDYVKSNYDEIQK